MTIKIEASGQACGAIVSGVDLSKPLAAEGVDQIREAWLKHHVLSFPGQVLSDDQLEQFSLQFGPFGDDPFIAPIAGRKHIIAVQREANETSPIFAEVWHTDWSFQATPPAGTCLYGITIPDSGGDTLFADQHKACQAMPAELHEQLVGKVAIHSATLGYSSAGAYGDGDAADRSMDIRPSDTANATQLHPILRPHPETGDPTIFGTAGYIIGIEGMPQEEAMALLLKLQEWQSQEQFVYRHKWQKNMLVMWDNRSVLHRATGGYEGQARLLHRTTIGEKNN